MRLDLLKCFTTKSIFSKAQMYCILANFTHLLFKVTVCYHSNVIDLIVVIGIHTISTAVPSLK